MRASSFVLFLAMTALPFTFASAEEAPRPLPPPAGDNAAPALAAQTAILAGGCYWGMQGIFEHVKGVQQVVAGYAGRPSSYDEDTIMRRSAMMPAEAVEITFDPSQVSYGQLLQIYFSVAHDPTQINEQGPDKGPQYRSNVFYVNDAQKSIAENYIAQLEQAHVFHAPIATRIDAFNGFKRAGNDEQDYMIHHENVPYVVINDLPRLSALKTILPDRYRQEPAVLSD